MGWVQKGSWKQTAAGVDLRQGLQQGGAIEGEGGRHGRGGGEIREQGRGEV